MLVICVVVFVDSTGGQEVPPVPVAVGGDSKEVRQKCGTLCFVTNELYNNM